MIWFEKISEFTLLAEVLDRFIAPFEENISTQPRVNGYCDKCELVKSFINQIDSGNWIDNRSQFECETCSLPARCRMFWKASQEIINTADIAKRILLLEAVTPFATEFRHRYPYALCSEYIDDKEPGSVQNWHGIQFISEDLLNLSFIDDELDLILHQDVLEHVPDADRAIREIHRVLRKGGKTLFSVPFYHACDASIKCAKIEDGELLYLTQPVYHGNPLSEEGSLVFELFGLDFFNRCKICGFSKVEIGLDYDINRFFLSNGNPYLVGKMLPVVFRLTK